MLSCQRFLLLVFATAIYHVYFGTNSINVEHTKLPFSLSPAPHRLAEVLCLICFDDDTRPESLWNNGPSSSNKPSSSFSTHQRRTSACIERENASASFNMVPNCTISLLLCSSFIFAGGGGADDCCCFIEHVYRSQSKDLLLGCFASMATRRTSLLLLHGASNAVRKFNL